MPNRWVCAQCGGPGDPDKVTALDPRYTTGRCASGKHKGPQRLVREDAMFTSKPKRKKVTQMPLPEPVPDAVAQPELPGADPLHPFADPRPDWADRS